MASNDLLIKVKADASQVKSGLAPADAALSNLDKEAKAAGKSIDQLGHAKAEITVSIKTQAVDKLKADIAHLRDQIAQGVIVGADTAEAQKRLRTLESSLRQLEGKPTRVNVDTRDAEAGLGRLESSISRLGGRAGGVVDVFGKGGLLAAGVLGAAGAFVKLGADAETAQKQLNAVIRDGGDAAEIFKQIKTFADTTPFEFPDLLQATKTLAAFGVKSTDLLSTLKNVGEVAAATGSDIAGLSFVFGQMLAKGKVTAEDMNQLLNRSVPAWEALAAVLGKSVDETKRLAEQGKISRAAIQDMITQLGGAFSGSIAAQADTFNGKLSTFNDTIRSIGVGIGTDLLPVAKTLLDTAQTIADVFPEGFGHLAVQIGLGVGAAKLLGGLIDGIIVKIGLMKVAAAEGAIGTSLLGGLTKTASFLGGPWGIALGAGVVLLELFGEKQGAATEATKQFSDALQFQGGALNAHNRAVVAADLQNRKLLDSADRLGLKSEDLVAAVLNEGEARAALNRILDEEIDKDRAALLGKNLLSQEPDVVAQRHRLEAALALRDGLGTMSGAFDTAATKTQQLAGASKPLISAFSSTTDAMEIQKQQWDLYDAALDKARSDLDKVINGLDILNGRFKSSEEAQIATQEAFAESKKLIEDTNKELDKQGKAHAKNLTAFDKTTETGRAYEKQLIAIATATAEQTEAQLKHNESAEAVLATYEANRKALIDTAVQMGLSTTAAATFADQILKTPKEVTVEMKQKGFQETANAIDGITKPRDMFVTIKLQATRFDREMLNRFGGEDLGPVPGGRSVAPSSAAVPFTSIAPAAALAVPTAPQVTVMVSDRRMADLIDVSIRSQASTVARQLATKRTVVSG